MTWMLGGEAFGAIVNVPGSAPNGSLRRSRLWRFL
jgi:hypothetical protein